MTPRILARKIVTLMKKDINHRSFVDLHSWWIGGAELGILANGLRP